MPEPFAELAARYALAVDRRDVTALAAVFAPGAAVVLPAALARGGPTTITDWSRLIASVTRYERTRHVVHQQVIDVAGDEASGETYADAHHLYRRGDVLRDSILALRYLDRFAGTDGDWRFTRRELVVDWISDTQVRSR